MRNLWWPSLGGPYAITWLSFVLTVVMAFPTTLWATENWPLPRDTAIAAQLAGLAGLLPALALARLTWLSPSRWTAPKPCAVLVTFLAASILRLAGMSAVIAGSGYWNQWPLTQSFIFGVMGQIVILCMVSIGTNVVQSHAETVRRLDEARATIARAKSITAEEIAQEEELFVADILASVQLSLEDFGDSSDKQALQAAVTQAAMDIVRPASHRLHSGEVVADVIRPTTPSVGLRQVLSAVRPAAPVWGPIAYEVLLLGTVWGALGASAAIINFGVGLAALVLLNLLLAAGWRRRPRGAPLAWLVGAYFLINAAAAAAVSAAFALVSIPLTGLWLGVGLYAGFMAILSILSSLFTQRAALESQLSGDVEEEARALAAASTLASEHRARLARLMHGGVQADLIAAAARLNISESDSTAHPTDAAISQLMSDLRDRHGEIRDEQPAQPLRDLIDVWALATDIDLSLDSKAAQSLEKYPSVNERIVAVVSEALANAVRHGAAQVITVCVAVDGTRLDVVVSHEGTLQSGDSGLGLAEIAQAADNWELRQVADQVVLHAEVDLPTS
jgi:signal transduction histidine kinase